MEGSSDHQAEISEQENAEATRELIHKDMCMSCKDKKNYWRSKRFRFLSPKSQEIEEDKFLNTKVTLRQDDLQFQCFKDWGEEYEKLRESHNKNLLEGGDFLFPQLLSTLGHGAGEGAGGVITAVYKLNLDCLQCVRQIQKSLQRTQGVQSVDVDTESNEIKVMGRVDAKEIHEQIVKISKRKVEMVTLQPKNKVDGSVSQKKGADEETKEAKELSLKKEIKEPISSTTILKVHMHCSKCEYDLKRKILKLKGVYSVKSDIKAQTLAIEGTIEPSKLVEYIHKKFHKHAEIVTLKREKKEQEEKKIKVTEKEIDVKIMESKNITVALEEKKLELKVKESSSIAVPYIVHYVYAPQLFSDENPNACSIQ